jgi:hypothetical protein
MNPAAAAATIPVAVSCLSTDASYYAIVVVQSQDHDAIGIPILRSTTETRRCVIESQLYVSEARVFAIALRPSPDCMRLTRERAVIRLFAAVNSTT